MLQQNLVLFVSSQICIRMLSSPFRQTSSRQLVGRDPPKVAAGEKLTLNSQRGTGVSVFVQDPWSAKQLVRQPVRASSRPHTCFYSSSFSVSHLVIPQAIAQRLQQGPLRPHMGRCFRSDDSKCVEIPGTGGCVGHFP